MADYDAHATAKDGELTFTVQGGDPFAPHILDIWAALQLGNVLLLEACFDDARDKLKVEILNGQSFGMVQCRKGKPQQAIALAIEMRGQQSTIDLQKKE